LEPAPNITGVLLGGLLSFFVLMGYNHFKTKKDNKTMRENMAELLRNELVANANEVNLYAQRGIRERPSILDNVYNGLLSSGNMRYLIDHQSSLYQLYAGMKRNDPDVVTDIRQKIQNLEQIFA